MNDFPHQPPQDSRYARRGVTFFLVALLHVCVILGPVWLMGVIDRKPKEQMFRVKIGGSALSKGPEVGMPERTPPRPAPPEPEVRPHRPEPKVPAVKPKPKEPKVPVVKPKPKPKPKPAVKSKPKEPTVPTVKPKPKPKPKRDNMDEVYRPPASQNLNPHVPVGTKDRAQKYAQKPDHKAPGGGLKVDEAAFARYGKNVERYIYDRWSEPPRSLLGGTFPETTVEITIEPDGRVSAAKVVKASSSRAMEESVKHLLAHLDLLPRPPDGRITFRITLKTR
jgi:TonB family protein